MAVIASSPSQSPKLDSDIDSQSLRKSRTRSTARSFATRPTAPRTPGAHPRPRASGRRPPRPDRRAHRGRAPSAARRRPAAPAYRRTAGRPPAGRSARPAAPRRCRRAAAPVASGRTESELPGSEGRGVALPRRAHGTGRRRDDSGRFPPCRGCGGSPGAADDRPGAWTRVGPGGRAPSGRRTRRDRASRAVTRPRGTRRSTAASGTSGPAPSSISSPGSAPRTRPSSSTSAAARAGRTAVLAQRWPGARVIGVDSSPEMLAAAAATAPERVEFVAGDVRDWAPDGPVDVVVSNAVLHWIPGHDRAASPTGPAGCGPADGWRCRCRATSGHPPTPCWPSSAGRPRWADRLAEVAPRPDAVLEPAGYLDVLTAGGAGRRRLGDDLPARPDRPGPGARLGAQHRAAPGAGPARGRRRAPGSPPSTPPPCAPPIRRGRTARPCCPSGGSSPSVPARPERRASRLLACSAGGDRQRSSAWPVAFLAAVFFAGVFLAVVFFAVVFLAAFFLVAGPRARRSASSSAARSMVIVSTSSPLRRLALVSPSVT